MPGQFAEIGYDKDGQLWARKLGSESYEPISEQEARSSYETGVEAVGQGIGRGVESAARGIPQAIADLVRPVNEAIAGPFGWEYDEGAATANRGRLQEIADAQRGSAGANPLAAPLGFFLPEAAASVGTMGVGVGGSLARRGALYGAGGFAGGAAASPEDPLTGGLLGLALGPVAGIGGEVITRGLVRGLGKGRAIVGASRRMDPEEPPGGMAGVREGEIGGPPGSMTGLDTREVGQAANRGWGMRARVWDEAPDEALNREAAELGFRLTPGVARGSKALKQHEASIEAKPGGAAAFAELREANDQALKGHLVKALGGEGTDLSPEALGQMKGTLENRFNEAGRQIPEVDLKAAGREIAQGLDEITDPEVRDWITRVAEKVPTKMNGPELMNRLQQYRKTADKHWMSEMGDRGKGEAMDRLADIVERHMLRQAPRQVRETLEDAGERWRLLRTVERGKTITSDGELSPVGLDSALRARYKNEYRYGGTTGHPDVERLSRASRVAYAMRDIVGNSGTATRSQTVLHALTQGQLERAYAKTYLEGLDLRSGATMAAAGGAGLAGGSGIIGGLLGE